MTTGIDGRVQWDDLRSIERVMARIVFPRSPLGELRLERLVVERGREPEDRTDVQVHGWASHRDDCPIPEVNELSTVE